MQAIVYDRYGPPEVLRLEEVPVPTPEDDEVRIEVEAASVNPADVHMMHGSPLPLRLISGLRRPKHRTLGADVAGRVDAVGPEVNAFEPGDAVFGDLSASGWGAFAEQVCAPAAALAPTPDRPSFQEAAAVPLAGVTALQGLRDKGEMVPRDHVLVNGASGGVGTFAVQIAKALGAEVTGVCSTRNLKLVRSIGADHVIDYTEEDLAEGGERFDLILDTAAHRPLHDHEQSLRSGGRYVLVGGAGARLLAGMVLGPWVSLTSSKRMGVMLARPDAADLAFLAQLIDAGKIDPVIDHRYPLAEVPEAVAYVEAGHTQGKVVLTV